MEDAHGRFPMGVPLALLCHVVPPEDLNDTMFDFVSQKNGGSTSALQLLQRSIARQSLC